MAPVARAELPETPALRRRLSSTTNRIGAMAAPNIANAHQHRQSFPRKSASSPQPRMSGDLILLATLMGVTRAIFAVGKRGPVGQTGGSFNTNISHGARKSRRIFLQRAGRTLRGASTTTSRMIACCWSQPVLPSTQFPATAAIVSLYGLFTDATTINGHLNLISGFLPEGALEVIGDQVKRIASHGQGALGATFLGTLAFSLWGANSGTKAIFDALNIIYKEQEKRSFLQLTIRSFIFTIGAVALVLLALAGIIAVPVIIKLLGVPDWSGAALLSKGRWPLLYVVILFALLCLYRYGPSRTHPQWKWVTLGSAIAGGLWVIGSLLLSWYVGNFGSYNATYGSLGAVIGFMMWMWFSTIIVLVGGEINAEMEPQTARIRRKDARGPWAPGAPKWPTNWARRGPDVNQGCAGALSQEQ
jgi:YihY family inner membrane protein